MDTSTVVSALIGGWFDQIADAVRDGRLQLISSDQLLDEQDDVVTRARIARYVSAANRDRLRQLFLQATTFVDPPSIAPVCRDESDDYLLALAEASGAQYLVTRDGDLLTLHRHGVTEIIYPARFLQLLGAGG